MSPILSSLLSPSIHRLFATQLDNCMCIVVNCRQLIKHSVRWLNPRCYNLKTKIKVPPHSLTHSLTPLLSSIIIMNSGWMSETRIIKWVSSLSSILSAVCDVWHFLLVFKVWMKKAYIGFLALQWQLMNSKRSLRKVCIIVSLHIHRVHNEVSQI